MFGGVVLGLVVGKFVGIATASWLAVRLGWARLPADVRGLLTGVELANYCAWFAPEEKVFMNGRFDHHRPELAAFIKWVRKQPITRRKRNKARRRRL